MDGFETGGDNPRVAKKSKKGVPSGHRTARIERKTKETKVLVELDLDGTGRAEIRTRVPFFDHMLTALAQHGLMDLRVEAKGDIEVDPHHTVEDVGLCLGRALLEAAGDKEGIERYGEASMPFDETLIRCALDLGGRPYLVYAVDVIPGRIGDFDVELSEVFFQAFATEARMNLHLSKDRGTNRHHIVEGCFKATARALARALEHNPRRRGGVASTKGVLD